ncbi:PilZ domain-containing protein [uncultured Ferrimonas sp.]|uniref:PilZ domain-containing protein n=1 Tax=uncultured Ferrimonas sp. TaxID=432640 RepID=UPI00262D90F5|nr:PilZ domain-containing protein [uncultured Ferrimonas sp.]
MSEVKPKGLTPQVGHQARAFPRFSYLKYRDPLNQDRATVVIELPTKFGFFRPKPVVAELQNVSKGGCAFVCQQHFACGSELTLHFSDSLQWHGVVRWIDRLPSGDVITGVQFTPILNDAELRQM